MLTPLAHSLSPLTLPRTYAAAAAWTPADLGSSVNRLWLQADAGTFQTSGGSAATAHNDPVGEWQDQSGNNRHGSNATSAQRPLLQIVTGVYSVLFDGTDDRLSFADFLTGLTEGEVYAIMTMDADPNATAAKTGIWDFGSVAQAAHHPWTDGTLYEEFGTSARKTAGNPTPSLATKHLYHVVSKNNDYAIKINNGAFYSTGTSTVGWQSAPRIGSDSAASFFLAGRFYELILCSPCLSGTDLTNMLSYLATRHTLTFS